MCVLRGWTAYFVVMQPEGKITVVKGQRKEVDLSADRNWEWRYYMAMIGKPKFTVLPWSDFKISRS